MNTQLNPLSAHDQDALLQASRRVDWRFLLPNPNLDQVALIGSTSDAHAESLRLFSTQLSIYETPSTAKPFQNLVVLTSPSLQQLRAAAALVQPGGWLYIEAKGLLWPKHWKALFKGTSLRCVAEYQRVLTKLGFGNSSAYWHWPNFEASTRLIPLDDRSAQARAFHQERAGLAAKLQSLGGALLAHSGILSQIVPFFSVLAQRLETESSN